jgi:hypothetical protein
MDGPMIEPRTVLWAVAEVFWQDPAGAINRAPGTLEDTSPSGACIRLKTPIAVGARLTVKWHREHFSAVARNCRTDGREFLLGVRREPAASRIEPSAPAQESHSASRLESSEPPPQPDATSKQPPLNPVRSMVSQRSLALQNAPNQSPSPRVPPEPAPARTALVAQDGPSKHLQEPPVPRTNRDRNGALQASAPPHERKVMPSKSFFPNLWRRQHDGTGALEKAVKTETPVNNLQTHPAESLTGSQSNLLSYDDIYHAAGILTPRSGYGVHKVVDMLNSDRIRELSKDIQRASVLMALDAAGTSPDDLLKDATHRQQALNSYEAGQQKQLEEFEERKAQENTKIQAEMDRVTTHYAERIKQNNDQVVREKEALRNWQMAKQHESQRISEVIELCAKQSAAAPLNNAQSPTAAAAPAVPAQPNLASRASAGH